MFCHITQDTLNVMKIVIINALPKLQLLPFCFVGQSCDGIIGRVIWPICKLEGVQGGGRAEIVFCCLHVLTELSLTIFLVQKKKSKFECCEPHNHNFRSGNLDIPDSMWRKHNSDSHGLF